MDISAHIVNKINGVLGRPAVRPDEYKFLDDRLKNYDPVIICFGGSIAYGTNTPQSDVDIRGAALNTPEEIILGHDFEQITNDNTDTTVYSFKKIIKLLAECNPNTIEMLGLLPEHYLYLSETGKQILKNKDMFLSLRCVNTFAGYAEQQMYRLRQKTLAAIPEDELNKHVVAVLNRMIKQLKEQYNIKDIEAKIKNGKIAIDISVKDYDAENLSAVLSILNKTINDYRKRSSRNEKALAHGKIAKHSMHLLRLYMMAEDLLLDGKVITYREKEHDLLMKIRHGNFLDEEKQPNKEFFDIVDEYKARFEYAQKHSVLPAKPDIERINKFIIDTNTEIIASRK